MRRGTLVFLLALILLFAVVGWELLEVFGWILVTILVLLVLLFGTLFVGAWLLKRRMQRKLAMAQAAFAQAFAGSRPRQPQDPARRDAIDVDVVDVRDKK